MDGEWLSWGGSVEREYILRKGEREEKLEVSRYGLRELVNKKPFVKWQWPRQYTNKSYALAKQYIMSIISNPNYA